MRTSKNHQNARRNQSGLPPIEDFTQKCHRLIEGDHPAMMDDKELLKQVSLSFGRTGGPGGQHRNRKATACTATHLPTDITGTATYYAGGGSGGSNYTSNGGNPSPSSTNQPPSYDINLGQGGLGGGGNGDVGPSGPHGNATAGTTNKGGGGGNEYGHPSGRNGKAGGSGVVIINEPGAGPFVASGVWRLKEVFEYKKENLWK